VQERGAFTLVLSGGSLFKALSPLISLPGVDFSRFHVFFVDERNVPYSSPDSNFKGADEVLLSKVLHSNFTPYCLFIRRENNCAFTTDCRRLAALLLCASVRWCKAVV